MFYYPNVLQRHTGCFAIIWLAATRGTRVTRIEYLKVNVQKTCNDIVDYVTAQVPPPQPMLPRPRFSLYLSSQLQYGVVLVFHKQCSLLLDEAQQAIEHLLRFSKVPRIDMVECDRLALETPDGLWKKTQSESAQDPFFGVMKSYQLISPREIHTAAKAAITMAEKEILSPTIPQSFEGMDLHEITNPEIDLLMAGSDDFFGDIDEQHTSEKGKESDQDTTSFNQMLNTLVGPEVSAPVPLGALDLEVTPAKVDLPTPLSEESKNKLRVTITPPLPKARSRRGHQLMFLDLETQISDAAMKEQIGNALIETRPMSAVMPGVKRSTPAQLFVAPCGPVLGAGLLSMWKQSAALPAGVGDAQGVLETGNLRTKRKGRNWSGVDMSSDSGLQISEGSSALDVIPDWSRESRSAGDSVAPVSGELPPGEVAKLSMGPIAEEDNEMPKAPGEPEVNSLLSEISAAMQAFGRVTFNTLLPPLANRGDAAHTLHQLLWLLSAGEASVLQTKPYATITIVAKSARKSA